MIVTYVAVCLATLWIAAAATIVHSGYASARRLVVASTMRTAPSWRHADDRKVEIALKTWKMLRVVHESGWWAVYGGAAGAVVAVLLRPHWMVKWFHRPTRIRLVSACAFAMAPLFLSWDEPDAVAVHMLYGAITRTRLLLDPSYVDELADEDDDDDREAL